VAAVAAQRNFVLASRYALVIPILISVGMSIITNNWWFLLGIPISFLGGFAGLRNKYYVYTIAVGAIIYFIIYGFNWKGYLFTFLILFLIGSYLSRLSFKWRLIAAKSQEIFQDNAEKE
jgi:hypothetical protein